MAQAQTKVVVSGDVDLVNGRINLERELKGMGGGGGGGKGLWVKRKKKP